MSSLSHRQETWLVVQSEKENWNTGDNIEMYFTTIARNQFKLYEGERIQKRVIVFKVRIPFSSGVINSFMQFNWIWLYNAAAS